MTEIEQLAELLRTCWQEMTGSADDVDGFTYVTETQLGEGRWMATMQVITQGPSGTYYAWKWERGLTENQEHIGPAEYGPPKITVVSPVKRMVEITEWVKVG